MYWMVNVSIDVELPDSCSLSEEDINRWKYWQLINNAVNTLHYQGMELNGDVREKQEQLNRVVKNVQDALDILKQF